MNKRHKKNAYVDRLNNSRRITRSISKSETGNENSLPIPIDLIITIFLKLPLKSIARCRCVSKLWAFILRRSDFTELFLNMSCSSSPKLLFTFRNKRDFFIFSSPQPQNPDEKSSHIVPNYLMKLSCDDYDENFDLVHGLVCLEDLDIWKICNPSTRQTLILPNVKRCRNSTLWRLFGYDPIGKQFKVLAMIKREMIDQYQVLTLGTEKMSWKMMKCCMPHELPMQNICINGVVYFTTIDWLIDTSPIFCFDVRLENVSFSNPTTEIINMAMFYRTTINLINYNGKLGLLLCEKDEDFIFLDGSSIMYKLWVLEDLEKQVWSDHTFLFPIVPENIVGSVNIRFLGVTQRKEIVLSTSYKIYPFCLFYLNLEKKTIVRVRIEGMKSFMDKHDGVEHIFLDHVEDVKLYGSV